MVTSSVGMRLEKQSSVLNSSVSPGAAVAHGGLSFENAYTCFSMICMESLPSARRCRASFAPAAFRALQARSPGVCGEAPFKVMRHCTTSR